MNEVSHLDLSDFLLFLLHLSLLCLSLLCLSLLCTLCDPVSGDKVRLFVVSSPSKSVCLGKIEVFTKERNLRCFLISRVRVGVGQSSLSCRSPRITGATC